MTATTLTIHSTTFNIGTKVPEQTWEVSAEVFTTVEDGANYHITGENISGVIHVQPYRFGIHPSLGGVTVTFGGYFGHVEAGNWGVKGSLACKGEAMVPGPAAYGCPWPLTEVTREEPETAALLLGLASAIAAHYAETYTGSGRR